MIDERRKEGIEEEKEETSRALRPKDRRIALPWLTFSLDLSVTPVWRPRGSCFLGAREAYISQEIGWTRSPGALVAVRRAGAHARGGV